MSHDVNFSVGQFLFVYIGANTILMFNDNLFRNSSYCHVSRVDVPETAFTYTRREKGKREREGGGKGREKI